MSLISVFLSGAPARIEAAARGFDLAALEGDGIRRADFSGGLSRPFLFPQDFLDLTGGGPESFWRLEGENLVQSETCGCLRLPTAACDQLIGIDPARLASFSETWNRQRARERDQADHSHTIWKSSTFRVLVGAPVAGFVISAALDGWPLETLGVLLALAWLGGSLAVGLWIHARARKRALRVPEEEPVDWVAPLKDLQRLCREARERAVPVYYLWSL